MLTEECLAHFQYIPAAKLAVYQQGEVELLPIRQPYDRGGGRAGGLLRKADGFYTLKHTQTHTLTHSLWWDVTSGPTKKFATVLH